MQSNQKTKQNFMVRHILLIHIRHHRFNPTQGLIFILQSVPLIHMPDSAGCASRRYPVLQGEQDCNTAQRS